MADPRLPLQGDLFAQCQRWRTGRASYRPAGELFDPSTAEVVVLDDDRTAMPQILQDNTVLLRFGMSLSDLIGLFDVTVGTGITFQKVQTPEVSAVNQQGTVIIKPGELMVITGLSRIVSTSDRRTLTEDLPVLAGGSRARQEQREHFVIVVRPVLL